MKRFYLRTILAGLTFLLVLVAGQSAVSEAELPEVVLTLGGQGAEDVAEGFADLLVPVRATESGLWLVNPRGLGTDDSEEEANIGVVYRHRLQDRDVIVGGNVYYDSRWTRYNNQFDQVGFGLEVLSEWVDARANYYLPEDDKELIDSSTETTGSSSSKTKWGTPFLNGRLIQQKGVKTTTITESTTLFENFEQAREGYDAEIGVKLPGLDERVEVRVFGGYYHFDSNFSGADDAEGFKGRLEVRALPALFLDAQVFEDKDLNGTDWLVGARLSLPFDMANLAKGKNPFAGACSRFDDAERGFDRRMIDMVMRDLAIRTEISGPIPTGMQMNSMSDKRGLLRTLGFVEQENGQEYIDR